ncbi:hypothetical protein BJG92_02172 [Arthrobacter sp. SO5]|nr:hypothetical protein [Arthrobacter sp. SO5]
MQSYPNEHVQVNGYLSLAGADYWTVKGINFGYSSANTTGQSIVYFMGGTGWSFKNNQVSGTRGVSNIMVIGQKAADASAAAQSAAAPHDYAITSNCIRNASATGTAGMMHNIYLMPTIYSSGGTIENNLIGNAPLGANIKAAGSTDRSSSPRQVVIRKNTLVDGASGIIIGQLAEGIETQSNLIATTKVSANDGGVRTWDLASPARNSVKDTMLAGYSIPIKYGWGQASSLYERRNVSTASVSLSGSLETCTLRASDSAVASVYGHSFAQ